MMPKQEKPKVLISACLNGLSYRYNGTEANDELVNKIKPLFELVNVCPEVGIGLPIPRKPIRLHFENNRFRVIQEESNLDLTKKLEDFSQNFLKNLKDICGCILKAKSPSCGIANAKFYKDNKIAGRTYGIFARTIKENLPYLPIIDEGRLRNKELFWEFLVKTFLLFRFYNSKSDIKNLIEFHSKYKYILMGLSQKYLKLLGQILAKHTPKNFKETLNNYEYYLKEILKQSFRRPNLANALTHIFGHISKYLSKKEKENFLKIIEKYRKLKIDFPTATEMLKIYVLRFEDSYLQSQYFFEPFPEI